MRRSGPEAVRSMLLPEAGLSVCQPGGASAGLLDGFVKRMACCTMIEGLHHDLSNELSAELAQARNKASCRDRGRIPCIFPSSAERCEAADDDPMRCSARLSSVGNERADRTHGALDAPPCRALADSVFGEENERLNSSRRARRGGGRMLPLCGFPRCDAGSERDTPRDSLLRGDGDSLLS